MTGDELSDAAQKEFSQALFPMGPENDQIRVPISGDVEDSRSYLVLRHA